MRSVFGLRIRPDDKSEWSEAEYYQTRKERDRDERMNRCLAGFRTHAWSENRTEDEITEMFQ